MQFAQTTIVPSSLQSQLFSPACRNFSSIHPAFRRVPSIGPICKTGRISRDQVAILQNDTQPIPEDGLLNMEDREV